MIYSINRVNFRKVYSELLKFLKKAVEYIKKIKIFKPEEPRVLTLKEEIELAHKEWMDARRVFQQVDEELIDYAVFRLNAAERKYMFLLSEAKKSGMCAWEDHQHDNNCEQSY